MVRKLTLVIATLGVLLSVVACEAVAPPPEVPSEIRIGCVVPMSGPLADMGLKIKDGAALAVEEINTRGGITGRKVILVVEDATDAQSSLLAIKKLVEENQVEVIVGPLTDDGVLRVGPYAAERQVLLLSPSATSPIIGIQPWSQWFFRTVANDALQAKALVKAIVDRGFKKVGILVQDTPYYIGIGIMAEELLATKADIVASVRYASAKFDYRIELETIRDKRPDCILHIGDAYGSAVLYSQALEMRLDAIQWVVGQEIHAETMFEIPEATEFMRKAVIGVRFVAPETSPTYIEFSTKYYNAFNTAPGVYCDNTYDAVKLIALAIEKIEVYDAVRIRDALWQVGKEYTGASGAITFDEKGDRVWAPYEEWKVEYEDGMDKFVRIRLPRPCFPWCE